MTTNRPDTRVEYKEVKKMPMETASRRDARVPFVSMSGRLLIWLPAKRLVSLKYG